MKDIFIFSAGPGGRDLFQLINDINLQEETWNILGYVDSDKDLQSKSFDGLEVFSPDYIQNQNLDELYGACGILDSGIRQKIVKNEILSCGLRIPSLVHPSSAIAHDFVPREGLIVFSGVNISYNVVIEKHVLVSFNSLVGHDSKVGEYVSLLPCTTIDGKCSIGKNSILGSGSIIHPGVSIGSNVTVGIGTVILDDVENDITITQLPRMIKLKK